MSARGADRAGPVFEVFVRGEATIFGRDLVPDRALIGARFVFDLSFIAR